MRPPRYCPLIKYEPQTPEGLACWQIARLPGVWRHVGMGGVLSGLDMTDALARLDTSLDADQARPLFEAIELGRLTTIAETQNNET